MDREEKQKELIELRSLTGMNRKEFSIEYDIPYQTITDWELGHRRVPEYLLRLLKYKIYLEHKPAGERADENTLRGSNLMYRQLALDYCCDADEIRNREENIFTIYKPLDGRRRFKEKDEMVLKIISVKGKLVFTGRKDIISSMQKIYKDSDAAWFMEPSNMSDLNKELNHWECKISQMHPFYVAYEPTTVPSNNYEIKYFERNDIEQFRGDKRFSNACAFQEEAPDELCVAAVRDNRILAMAGASGDSPYFWQIGIDVLPEARGEGLGVQLVSLLKNEVLRRGRIPYYGTAVSHTLSQNIAIRSGFHVGWTELVTEKVLSHT